MRALAAFVLRGPVQAIAVTVALALIPFVSSVSGSVVALVALQLGAVQGLVVTAGSSLVIVALALLSPMPAMIGVSLVVFKATEWLPVWLLAVVLRITRSLAVTMQAAAVLGTVTIAAVFMLLSDPAGAWLKWLDSMRPMWTHLPAVFGGAQGYAALKATTPYMTGIAAGLAVLGAIVVVIIGRGAQAALVRPGALRGEFNSLRLGRSMSVIAVLVLAAAIVSKSMVIINFTIMLLMVLPLYGLAVIYGALHRLRAGGGWLFGLYMIIFLAPVPALFGLVLVALLDSWLDFRARIPQR